MTGTVSSASPATVTAPSPASPSASPSAQTGRLAVWLPWTDRRGRLSWLRLAVFALSLYPALKLLLAWQSGALAAEPYKMAIHLTGHWSLYFLLATLAITPFRQWLGWAALPPLRRMLGVTGFAYAGLHLLLHMLDHSDNITGLLIGMVSRANLLTGLVAVIGLGLLAATSFDGVVRRMGRNWKRLHRLAYPLTALALLHFFMQSKADITLPVLLAGLFCGLMGFRLLARLPVRVLWFGFGLPVGLVAALLTGLVTAGLEAGWYAGVRHIPAERVLSANLDLAHRIAPAWYVLALCCLPALGHGLIYGLGRAAGWIRARYRR